MFLMVAAIRRTNRAFTVTRRLGEAMSDAAISIFITSFTDIFSFGVGTLTTIPAVQLFCFYTCSAMAFTFLYQVNYFSFIIFLILDYIFPWSFSSCNL